MIARAEHTHAPTCRKVSVQVETGWVTRLVNGEAVKVFDKAFLNQSVTRYIFWRSEWADGHHHASVLIVFNPSAVWVGNSHRQDSSVTVDILRMKTRPQMTIAPRPRPHTRAMKQWLVSEGVFDAVGVYAWCNIKSSCAQCFDNYFVAVIEFFDKVLNYVQCRCTTCDFGGVNVGVDPVRRFCMVCAGCCVGDGWCRR